MDRPVLACRPVKLDPSHWLDRQLAELTIYDGAIEVACEICEELCYLGPRQQEQAQKMDCEVLCSRCVIALQAQFSEPFQIRHLGNPQKRAP